MGEMSAIEASNVLRSEGQRALRYAQAILTATDCERDIAALNAKKAQAETDTAKALAARDKVEADLVDAKQRASDDYAAHHATLKSELEKRHEQFRKDVATQTSVMQKSYEDHQQKIVERRDQIAELEAAISKKKAELNNVILELNSSKERMAKFIKS